MKDELKKFIGENREAFDDKEPSAKVWEQVEKSLPNMKQRRLWNSLVMWRMAAGLFLGLSLYLFALREKNVIKPREHAKSQNEFADMESFYRNEIAQKVELIHHYDGAGESDQVTQSFQKLDAMYQVLGEEMKNNPDRKVKDAMILNLLVRIDLLNQQLKKLEDSKKNKKNTESEV